ncbi:MAG: hypothetical protein JRG96_16215 [Deltaproteobacteria bacterium]|nr:hypothetical protein [Deltaproteobacteria bacterium]
MSRTRLRGIELAGIRLAIEAPPSLPWTLPDASIGALACSPWEPDLYVGVRVGRPHVPPCETVVYTSRGVTFEVGRVDEEWVIAVYGPGGCERVACFDSDLRQGEVVISPEAARSCRYPLQHPLDELVVLHRLALEGGLLLRGRTLLQNGRALLLLGGATQMPGDSPAASSGSLQDAAVVNEQYVALRIREDACGGREVWLHTLPWSVETAGSESICAPLEAIHVTEAGETLSAEHLVGDRAICEILEHAFAPVHDSEYAERLLCSVESVASSVPVLRIRNPAPRHVLPMAWGRREAALGYAPPSTA